MGKLLKNYIFLILKLDEKFIIRHNNGQQRNEEKFMKETMRTTKSAIIIRTVIIIN
ncbi:hypothetical protein KAK10_01245 [Periweissella beninensis]|uniref:Uncharacterized protein n=1 Tax=Periweissella beninensis TaxID=504936 RepID=A0ABT0VFU1_9LACO|nr:hypothetical protein [Periweissella beninensis]